MSGHIFNELTVYLRPQEAVQPYIIVECAKWMARTGRAPSTEMALKYLHMWDYKNPAQFLHMISEYHRNNDYQSEVVTNFRKNINATYSKPGGYGEDVHMYYNIQNLRLFM